MIVQGSCHRPEKGMLQFYTFRLIPPILPNASFPDKVVWTLTFWWDFTANSAWNAIRRQKTKVPWYKLAWIIHHVWRLPSGNGGLCTVFSGWFCRCLLRLLGGYFCSVVYSLCSSFLFIYSVILGLSRFISLVHDFWVYWFLMKSSYEKKSRTINSYFKCYAW